jgi:hypothetical protein
VSDHQTVSVNGWKRCVHCHKLEPDGECKSRPNPVSYPVKFPDGYFTTPSMEYDEDWETIKRESKFEGEHGPESVQFSGEEKIVSKADLVVHPATGLLQIANRFSDYLPSTDHDESNVQAAINYMRHRGYLSPEPPKQEPVLQRIFYDDGRVELHGLKLVSSKEIGPEDRGWDGNPHTTQFEVEFSTAGMDPKKVEELFPGMTMTMAPKWQDVPGEYVEPEATTIQRKAMGSRITNLRKEARQLNKAVIRRNRLIQRLYAKLEKKEEARKRWQKHAQAYENKYNAARTQLLRERCSESEWQQKFAQQQARYDSDMASAGKLPTAHGTSIQAARIEELQANVKDLQTKLDTNNETWAQHYRNKDAEIARLEEDVSAHEQAYENLQNRFRLVEGDAAWQALKVAQLKRKVKGLTKDLKKAVANKK